MDHQAIRENLFLLGDAELSILESAAIEQHLKSCGECRQALKRWENIRGVFSHAATVPASDEFTASVMRRLDASGEGGWKKIFSIFRSDWMMPTLGYAFAVLLMCVAIAHRAPLENIDKGLLSGAPPSEQWVVSDENPDMRQLLGITMEES